MNILLVDGYNIIGAWGELQVLKDKDLAQARDRLIEIMAEYQAYTGDKVIIVFDAHEVRGKESIYKQLKVEVIYTKENETADQRIESLVGKLKNVKTKVYVATSDYDEQRVIFGRGAFRISARELKIELQDMEREINFRVMNHMKSKPQIKIPLNEELLEKFEKMRRGES